MPGPRRIGARLRVTHTHTSPTLDPDLLDIVVDQGAFGSGEHETTVSCLEVLEGLPGLGGARMLDLGSGTGILALAALRLGASQAVCVDVDPGAVATARRNAELNGLSDRVSHVAGELTQVQESGFDLVVANLYADLLITLAPELLRRVRPGGMLLLGGILWEHAFQVRHTYETLGCTTLDHRVLEEYCTLLLEPGPSPADQPES